MASGNFVKLNIGGSVFQTTKSTLTRFDGMLKVMIETEIPVEKDESGCIFIDRDPTHFRLILNFLRDGLVVTLPDSEKEILEIQQEAQFYQLNDLMELCKRQLEPTNDFRVIETDKEMLEVITHPKKSVLVIHLPANQDGTITYPLGFDANVLSTKYGSNYDIYYKPYKIFITSQGSSQGSTQGSSQGSSQNLPKDPFFFIYQAGCVHARPNRHICEPVGGTVPFMQAVENEIERCYKMNDSTLKMASGNVVKLNIGGTVFQTTKSTLTRFDGMLKVMMETGIPVEKDECGCVFIDRSPKHFDEILNFLRDGHVALPDTEKEILEIQQEAQYYLLDGLAELCKGKLEHSAEKRISPTHNLRVIKTDEEMLEIITYPKKPVLVIHLTVHHGAIIFYPDGFDANTLSIKYGSVIDIYYKLYKANHKLTINHPFFVIHEIDSIPTMSPAYLGERFTSMATFENEIARRLKIHRNIS